VAAEQPAVVDPLTLTAADGAILRLVMIHVRPPEAAAAVALERSLLADGSEAEPLGADRWGRTLAVVRLGGGDTLQGRLVAAGLALVDPAFGASPELATLFAAEAGARAALRGAWGRQPSPIEPADRVEAAVGSFVIVEGRVLAVDAGGAFVYLNFGPDRRIDFTLRATSSDFKRWRRQGLDLERLAGQMIRVRGWLAMAGGPLIELTRTEQLETDP
jgi:hypothetical protein